MKDLGSKKALELAENVSVQVFNLWCTLTWNTGSIFWAVDLIERNHTVVVKTSSFSRYQSLLQHKHVVLDQLCGTRGILDIVWSGTESEQNIIVFKDQGKTLEDIFKSTGQKLSMSTISLLAEKLVHMYTETWPNILWKNSSDNMPSRYPLSQLYVCQSHPKECPCPPCFLWPPIQRHSFFLTSASHSYTETHRLTLMFHPVQANFPIQLLLLWPSLWSTLTQEINSAVGMILSHSHICWSTWHVDPSLGLISKLWQTVLYCDARMRSCQLISAKVCPCHFQLFFFIHTGSPLCKSPTMLISCPFFMTFVLTLLSLPPFSLRILSFPSCPTGWTTPHWRLLYLKRLLGSVGTIQQSSRHPLQSRCMSITSVCKVKYCSHSHLDMDAQLQIADKAFFTLSSQLVKWTASGARPKQDVYQS